jgi:SnoaL-like polyketide cyclase
MDAVSDRNKRKVRLFIEAVWNEGRLDLIDELIAVDYAGHLGCADEQIRGREEMQGLVSSYRLAHPGLYVRIEDQVAEDDRVATRWIAIVIRSGARGSESTSCCSGITIIRLLGGKQVDSHTACTSVSRGTVGG